MEIANKEFSNKFKSLMKNPSLLILLIAIFVVLFIFIIYPLFKVLIISSTDNNNNFSLDVYKSILSNDYMKQGFKNSRTVDIQYHGDDSFWNRQKVCSAY